MTRELYLSVDVEADGRVPGPYSMVSLGACAAALRDERGAVTALDPGTHTFYRELRPISDTWDPEALAVSGLTREHLEEEGSDPADAMNALDDAQGQADLLAALLAWGAAVGELPPP